MEMLGLVALARITCMHEILHDVAHVGKVDVAAKTMKRALHSLMPVVVNSRHVLLDERGHRWKVEAATELEYAVHDLPRLATSTCANFIMNGH
jgi:hypothetical protein